MLVVYIILLVACLVVPIIIARVDRYPDTLLDWETLLMWYCVSGLIALFPLIGIYSLTSISTGEKTYTGYIYSSEDVLNKTTGHLRFSESAGEDTQPSFCAAKGSEAGKRIKELAGSGKKVKVTVPSGFSVQMWYGQCPLPVTVEEME